MRFNLAGGNPGKRCFLSNLYMKIFSLLMTMLDFMWLLSFRVKLLGNMKQSLLVSILSQQLKANRPSIHT
jgi:hypothetical protein